MLRSAAPIRSIATGAPPQRRLVPTGHTLFGRRFPAACLPPQHASVELQRSATAEWATTAAAPEGTLAQRLRLGKLEPDGLSYKESFIVRSYEVGVNKTATVETIANLLQVSTPGRHYAHRF